MPVDGLACAKEQRRQYDIDLRVTVASDMYLWFVGDLEVVAADDHCEITTGVDVAAAAGDCQPCRPPRECVRRTRRPRRNSE